MKTQELEEQKIKVLKEISEINLLVAEAKATLIALESQKNKFFEDRDKEALERVDVLLKESKDLLKKTYANYEQVHEFFKVIEGFSKFIEESYNSLSECTRNFEENREVFEDKVKKKEKELAEAIKQCELDRKSINRDKAWVETMKADLDKRRKRIESQQIVLKTAYKIMREEKNGN